MTLRPRPLVIEACRSECAWSATSAQMDGEAVFACGACDSEWVPSEAWTPVDWQGEVPEAVRAAREQQSTAPTTPITTSLATATATATDPAPDADGVDGRTRHV